MTRVFILKALLVVSIMGAAISGEDDMKEEVEKEVRNYMLTRDYCSLDEFEDMDYYLFCDTKLCTDVGPAEYESIILSVQTQAIGESKELYQEFKARLGLSQDIEAGSRVTHISSDCRWIRTERWTDNPPKTGTLAIETLFCEKEKVREESAEYLSSGTANLFVVVRNGDSYEVMDEQLHSRLVELEDEKATEGYLGRMLLSGDGTLITGIKDDSSLLTVRKIEDRTVLWNFPLQEIWEDVKEIRKDSPDGNWNPWMEVIQFEGNEKEGWIIVQGGLSSFFRIDYPSGKVTYLGEYMYSLCYSPDGKYAAYSSVDYDNAWDMSLEEQERIASGIYIMEVNTGKTAYICWDILPGSRSFMWIEKEGFEEYMGDTGNKE